jgi:hypothetical protein
VVFNVTGRAWPKPPAGVRLQYRLGTSTTWVTAVTVPQLDADGRFTQARKHSQNVAFRLVRSEAVSPVIHVGVHPAMTLVAAQTGFHGTFYPHLTGASVQLQRFNAGSWVPRETVTVNASGAFAFTTDPTTGQWRVWFAGDSSHAAGASPTLNVAAAAHVLVLLG